MYDSPRHARDGNGPGPTAALSIGQLIVIPRPPVDTGRLIGALRIPTLFVLEGGYAVAEIGVNAVNVLQGFEAP